MSDQDPTDLNRPQRIKGRGAASNREGRFEALAKSIEDDGWHRDDEGVPRPATQGRVEQGRSSLSHNDSPDLPFSLSINPYRGCEHGCNYCYARPSHSYLNLSPGLDFETRLFAKTNAAELLREELRKPGHVVSPITLGANTDCYQPIEREYRITRSIIEVLAECRHPLTILTKNALVERDIDLLAPMAEQRLVQVFVSINALDNHLASSLEPRASAPHRRMQAIATLNAAGVPCGVLVAPVIPVLTDHEVERVLEASAAAGASSAAYVLLRLPYEVKTLFREWLEAHFPETAAHVMARVAQLRGGRDNDSDFRTRMSGQGAFASLLRQRFEVACRRLQLEARRWSGLDTTQFRRPAAPDAAAAGQLSLDF